ncbi:MAG: hypothetical protein AUJ92_20870 [Armatimonadetes bacterium CG2_30_59_28]|nr:MAG: hypothetical protein AUJ92_20870 [Armatimonadetes bacterium CG2_30_59_28]
MEGNLRSAFTKLCTALPEKVSIHVKALAHGLSFVPAPVREVDPEVFTRLTQALRENRRVRLLYYTQHRRKETDRLVDPWHLYNHEGDWYLVGHCHTRRAVRSFLLSRIRECALTKQSFEVPGSFDANAYIHESFGVIHDGKPVRIKIAFDADQAPYILERQWHPSQKTTQQEDGGVHVEFRISGLSGSDPLGAAIRFPRHRPLPQTPARPGAL